MQQRRQAPARRQSLCRRRERRQPVRSLPPSGRDRTLGLGGGPRRHRRRLRYWRLGYDIEEVWSAVPNGFLNRTFHVLRIGHLSGAKTEPARDRGVINRIEIDPEVAIVVIEVLELLDPTKSAVRALEDDDRQSKPGDSFQLADRHAEAPIAGHTNHSTSLARIPGT